MSYDPALVEPMRRELAEIGVKELLTADDVSAFMAEKAGSALLIVNSVCGCAAGSARPAIRIALQSEKRPDRIGTVFAGQDVEATQAARAYFADYPPSSPSMALIKDGEVACFIPRHAIEGRDAQTIAFDLIEAFETFC